MRPRLGVAALLLVLIAAPNAGAAKPFRIGMVLSLGSQPSTTDIGGVMYNAFIRAAHAPGVEGRVVFAPPSNDPSAAVALLVRQGYDVVVMPLLYASVVESYARQYPHTTFLGPDLGIRPRGAPANLVATLFEPQAAAYLAGYLAALMEDRRPGRHVISAVGGIPYSAVNVLIAGFRAGARAADPRLPVLINYSHDFWDPTKCATVAREQIARGSGVVFNVAGRCGYGALIAAKRAGVWGVGVDTDQSQLGRFILTSAVKYESVAMRVALHALQGHRFPKSGEIVFNYLNGGVGLGKISPDVPRGVLARLARVQARLASGEIEVPTTIK